MTNGKMVGNSKGRGINSGGRLRPSGHTDHRKRVNGTTDYLHRPIGVSGSASIDRIKEETARRIVQWGIVIISFAGLFGVFTFGALH